ncbi:hypothetical protein COEREDRAFT_89302 [Coemansia reversa NRRL 1564]|uniref:Uncharacterized protein n=1 Tax=Coemansia reversa (strain ATCC 12441 / NRRL 1564) TaxID=763665 RepID=A0A2G5B410_COERN|nr:hypothetical protein COEREDRAFT_89302 [Coemansia reversa NRRL 1564]|eukprot:PIA13783.1 hypothetical protein COEREDRAFT_89302 [Coemansia reversa NRRL 1564]
MFSSRKSKGRRNIRKKDFDTNEDATNSESTDVIKRSSKLNTDAKVSGASNLRFGNGNPESVAVRKERSSMRAKEFVAMKTEHEQVDQQYPQDDMSILENAKVVQGSESKADDVIYPFSNEGLPNAKEIYMAKKLRQQRRAAQHMDVEGSAGEEDFIKLSDDMANSQISGEELDNLGGPAVEGEDEFDTVIIDKNERAEFARSTKKALEESIEHAHDDEISDWEHSQLRNAGIVNIAQNTGKQIPLPKDNGFEFNSEDLKFMIAQENNQLGIENERLKSANEQLEASTQAAENLQRDLEQAQKQYDHFLSMVKELA